MERYELNRLCPDGDCGGIAEPEEELGEGGLLRYWVCATCQTEFGYEVIREEAQAGSCQLGIPEAVRARVSTPPPDNTARSTFLGATIARRPE